MAKVRTQKSKKKIGQAPGSIIYTGEKPNQELFIEAFDYNEDKCIVRELLNVEECFEFKGGMNKIRLPAHAFRMHPVGKATKGCIRFELKCYLRTECTQ